VSDPGGAAGSGTPSDAEEPTPPEESPPPVLSLDLTTPPGGRASTPPPRVIPLDLSTEAPRSGALTTAPPLRDLEPGRDTVRAVLALGLLGLLALIVIGSGLVLALDASKADANLELLKLVFTPVVGLVGSAMGFYFGAGAGRGSNNRNL